MDEQAVAVAICQVDGCQRAAVGELMWSMYSPQNPTPGSAHLCDGHRHEIIGFAWMTLWRGYLKT